MKIRLSYKNLKSHILVVNNIPAPKHNFISKQIKRFYKRLYISTRPDLRITKKVICNVGSEDVHEISRAEIKPTL